MLLMYSIVNIAHRCKQTQISTYRYFNGLCLHRFFAKIVGISKKITPENYASQAHQWGLFFIFCQYAVQLNIANTC